MIIIKDNKIIFYRQFKLNCYMLINQILTEILFISEIMTLWFRSIVLDTRTGGRVFLYPRPDLNIDSKICFCCFLVNSWTKTDWTNSLKNPPLALIFFSLVQSRRTMDIYRLFGCLHIDIVWYKCESQYQKRVERYKRNSQTHRLKINRQCHD